MKGGLVSETSGGQWRVMDDLTASGGQSGGNSNPASGGPGLDTDVNVEGTEFASIDSHLDSFFKTHAVTREDVTVVLGLFQALMWIALIYLEVSD